MRSWLIIVLLFGSLAVLSLPTAAQRPSFTNDPSRIVLGPPPAGGNSVLVPSGQTATLPCPAAPEGSGLLCAPQIAFDVPANATGFTINVSANGEFIVFVRFGLEVELIDGSAISDFVLSSRGGQVTFPVPAFEPGDQFPGLQEGRYFLAIAHFENGEDQRYSITPQIETLQTLSTNNSAEFNCSLNEILCNQQFSIEVTRESELRFEVQGEGNFQIFVRHDSLVQRPPLTFNADGAAVIGDIMFDHIGSPDGSNTANVVVNAISTPPLQPGTYYLAFTNLENFNQNFTITTTLGDQGSVQPPNAGFGFSPFEPRVGDSVQFTDTSTAGIGTLSSWSWDFGDGQTSTQQHPTHSYAAPGTYRVSLLVFNDSEQSATIAQTITVLPQTSATPTAVEADVSVIAFMELMLVNPDAWERTIQDGCVVYANVSDDVAVIQIITLDEQVQTIDVAASQSVLVCGNAIHLNL